MSMISDWDDDYVAPEPSAFSRYLRLFCLYVDQGRPEEHRQKLHDIWQAYYEAKNS